MATVGTAECRAEWTTLGDLIRGRAASAPEMPALYFTTGDVLTNADLNERSDRVAASLQSAGVRKGATVATYLYNGGEQVLVWAAAAKVGAIFVPLNVSLRGVDLGHTLKSAHPVVVVIDDDLLVYYEDARSRIEGLSVVLECTVGAKRGRGYESFNALEQHTNTLKIDDDVVPSDAATVLFTGGTTGPPRGVVRTHFSYLCAAERYRAMFNPALSDRHHCTSQLFHCAAHEMGLVGPLASGISSVLVRSFSASEFLTQVREYGSTIMDGLGAILAILIRQPAERDDADNPLRIGWSAAQSVPRDVVTQFSQRYGVELLEVYGLTETGSLLVSNRSDDKRVGSVGRPRGWCDLAIVDDKDQELGPGERGEIVIRPTVPYSMSLGYYREPAATVDHWRNLWVHTGDTGYVDGDGWLYLVGRQAHWIRRRGENVSSLEVEQLLDQHPAVLESAVVGVPSEVAEEDIKACLVLNHGATLAPEEIIEWCGKRLAFFKVPRYIEFLEELPRSASKREIERYRLRDLVGERVWDRQRRAGLDAGV